MGIAFSRASARPDAGGCVAATLRNVPQLVGKYVPAFRRVRAILARPEHNTVIDAECARVERIGGAGCLGAGMHADAAESCADRDSISARTVVSSGSPSDCGTTSCPARRFLVRGLLRRVRLHRG